MKETNRSLYYKGSLPSVKTLFLLMGLALLGGCWLPQDSGNADDPWDWDAGNGMVNIRIALNSAERFSLPLDNPSKDYVTYYEAVLREQGTAHYYIGTAVGGESYIRVSVLPGKTYDILVLAGTAVNGQASNGVKVLLASGWVPGYTVVYGQNRIGVPMSLHTTTDTFAWDENAEQFTYTPKISKVSALLAADPLKINEDLLAGTLSQLIPYPDPYAAEHKPLAVTLIATDNTLGGSLTFTIKDELPEGVKKGISYRCYYNLTYYAFSDPASRSSPWDIRRGITNDLYTEESMYGGGIPLNACYYVKADGNDANLGYLKEKPFKTLAKAIKTVRAKTIPWIQTIVVLGELNWTSESTADYSGYRVDPNVFVIPNPQPDESAVDLIRITGDPALTGGGSAVLSGMNGRRVLSITGADTKIQFDHIKISDGNVGGRGGGIYMNNGSQVTIDEGTVISNNIANSLGGGIICYASRLIMKGGEIRNNSTVGTGNDGYGGGIWIENSTASFTMSGGIITENFSNYSGAVNVKGSGVTFTMMGGKIINNPSDNYNDDNPCGGVRVESSASCTLVSGTIAGNTAGGPNNLRALNSATIFVPAGSADIAAGTHTAPAQWTNDITIP